MVIDDQLYQKYVHQKNYYNLVIHLQAAIDKFWRVSCPAVYYRPIAIDCRRYRMGYVSKICSFFSCSKFVDLAYRPRRRRLEASATDTNKKSELMLMIRAKAYSSSCSQIIRVYLHPFRLNSFFCSQKSPKNH